MFHRSVWLILGMTVVELVVPPAGWGQAAKSRGAAPPRAETEIEEITVTAQKREENIQEVPISVTAITGAALEQKGESRFTDLTESVPNLYAQAFGGSASTTSLAMRGTSNNQQYLSTNSTVGLYVDGFAISKVIESNLDLEDLERVEVLRGPQGTLFGRNTIGGAINLVTQKPTAERSITVATEVGNYDAFKGRVTLNVPLIGKNGYFQSDAVGTLSLRENVMYKSHDGFAQNQSPTNVEASGGSELGTMNHVLSLTGVRWQPTKDITLDYSFEYHRHRQTPLGWQVTTIFPKGDPNYNAAVNPGGPFDLTPYVQKNRAFGEIGNHAQWDNNLNSHRLADDGNHRMHILTAAWDLGALGPLGNVTLKSISGYRYWSTSSTPDLDASPLHIFDDIVDTNFDSWSEELQWVGTAPRLQYVLGAYYYGEHSRADNSNVIFGGAVNYFARNLTKNSSYAPFGQATWTPPILNDKLSLTVGLRYSEDHVHSQVNHKCITTMANVAPPGAPPVFMNLCNQGIPGLVDFNASVGKTFGRSGPGLPGLTPVANIAYQWTEDLMTYVRASRGYQSGAVSDHVNDPRLFGTTNPERLESYEAGFKSEWFGKRLRFNADGFLNRYKDQLITVNYFSPTGGIEAQNVNAGKSEYWGSEVELSAIPIRGLEATANYAYLAAKFLEFVQQKSVNGLPVFDQNGKPVLENVAGREKVTYAPANTFSVGLTYTAPPTTAGVFSAHLDTYWSASYVTQNDPADYSHSESWAYAVVNGRVQLVDIPLARGSLDLSVFGKNLFDRKYRLAGFSLGALGWVDNVYGDPRTFGVGLTYHFTAS